MKKLLERLSRIPNSVWLTVAALSVVAEALRRIFLGGGCVFKQLLGIPCPACGMSRAYISLFTLNIEKAFYYNPAFLTFPIALVTCALAFADKKRTKLWLILFAIDTALFLTVWIVRLATGTAV